MTNIVTRKLFPSHKVSQSRYCDWGNSFPVTKCFPVTIRTTWTTIYDSGSLALSALTVGKRLFSTKVPAGVQRYLRVNYSVGTGPLTAGAFTSGINLDVYNNTPYYPTRSKVTG